MAALLLTKRQLKGLLIAPLAAPVAFSAQFFASALVFVIDKGDMAELIGSAQFAPIFLLATIIVGSPVSYGIAVIFGLPVLKILEKINKVNLYSILISSAILGTIPVITLEFLFPHGLLSPETIGRLISFALSGTAVGAVFWFIAYRRQTPSPPLQENPPRV